jgi:hypothetical protein
MLLPVLLLPLLGLCHAQQSELQPARLARSIIAGYSISESTVLDRSVSLQERSPQTGCSVGKACGTGCMPLTGICCGGAGTYCTLGNYCTDNGGCCPVGKTCKGTPPPPTSVCDSNQVECGGNNCMPRGAVCCSSGHYCNAGETCASGLLCKSGSGGGNGGNGDGSSITKPIGYTPTSIGDVSFSMPSAPPSLFWTKHATSTPTDDGQSVPTSTSNSGNNNPGNPGGKSAAGMVHAPNVAAALVLLVPLLV